jgi:hypothetical protein
MLYRQSRSQYHYKNGPFSIVPNLPGVRYPGSKRILPMSYFIDLV